MTTKISNVNFLLAAAVGIVVVLTVTVLFVVSSMLHGALTGSIRPFLDMASQVAAKAAAPGLKLDNHESLNASLQPFAQNGLFSYIRVKDKHGAQLFVHRKNGLAALSDDRSDGEVNGELFRSVPVTSDGQEVGTLTMALSLEGRNAAVAAARWSLIGLGVGAVILMVLSMKVLLRVWLERPLEATASEIAE